MTFQEQLPDRLQPKLTEIQTWSALPHERPVRIFCEDDSRVGLLPVHRRCITLRRSKPLGTVQYWVESFSVDGAVDPTPGESCFLELPQRNPTNVQIFLQEVAQRSYDPRQSVFLETGSGPPATSLLTSDHGVCWVIPPDRPELNPIARLWRARNDQVAWLLVAPIEEVAHQGERLIRHYSKSASQSLPSYAYLAPAVYALSS
jgi:hypothetical protein